MEATSAFPSATTAAIPLGNPAKPPPKPRHTLQIAPVGGGEAVKIQGKYPMPLKAPKFNIVVNGLPTEAAVTEFKGQKYTYFTYQGASFWVYGAFQPESQHTIEIPDGYDFAPAKVDRKVVAAQSAASAQKRLKSKKEATAANGAEGNGAAPADATNGAAAPATTEPAAAALNEPLKSEPAKGKKAQR